VTTNKELQKKAEDFFRSKKWDKLLLKAYDSIAYYSTYAERNDKGDWNIGLEDISTDDAMLGEMPEDDSGRSLVATIRGMGFKIAGKKTVEGGHFGDDPYFRWRIRLFIDNAEKVDAIYHCDCGREYTSWQDYSFVTLNAFHNDDRIGLLLDEISRAIDRRESERERKRKVEAEARLEGKFSL